jgi:soluble lytic murein transglycosylase-like protein
MTMLALVLAPLPASACWEEAGRAYGIDPWLLYGIAIVESGLNPAAVNRSHWRRTGSYDLGLMQINSRNFTALARDGVAREALWDPCTNIFAGARILREKIERHGNTWEAVGAYNAACTSLKGQACRRARSSYAWKVYRAMQRAMNRGR